MTHSTELETRGRVCGLVIDSLQYYRLECSYDAKKNNPSHQLTLVGRVDDAWYDTHGYPQASAFHNKPVRLEIYPNPDEEELENTRKWFTGGKGDLCGVVRVNASVEPDEYQDEPIFGDLFLNAFALEAIRQQMVEALGLQLVVRAELVLFGDAVNAIVRDTRMSPFIKPRELDVSVFHGYGVRRLEIITIHKKEYTP